MHSVQDGLTDLLYVLLPILAQTFGLNYSQVGIIRAANRTAMTLFEIPSSVISERLGERALLTFGLLCAGLGYLALARADGFVAVLACLFVAGFGAAFQHALSSSVISTTFQGAGRRAALGAYNSSGDIGKLVFAGLFTLAIGAGVAWREAVAGFGGVALLSSLILFVILHRLDVGSRSPANNHVGKTSPGLGWGIRDRTAFAALATIVFLDIAVQAGFLTFLAFLMIEKQVPTALAAFAVVLTLAGGVFGKFFCGILAERVGVIRALILTECLSSVGIIAILLSPTMIAFLLLPMIGAVLQGSSSITYGTVSDLVHPDRQSRGFALIYSIATSAGIAAPLGFGLIGDQFGLAPAMLVMAVIVLLPVPLCLPLKRMLSEKYA